MKEGKAAATFGGRLQMLRKEKGMTQEALAGMLGVTNQAVSKWEGNVCYPDVMLLGSLADALGTTADGLLGHAAKAPLARVQEQVRVLTEETAPEDVFDVALRLAGRLHEGVFTLGYTQAEVREAGGPEWDFTSRVEREGATVRVGRTVLFGAQGEGAPDGEALAGMARMLEGLMDARALRVLFALADGEVRGVEALAEGCGLTVAEVKEVARGLPLVQAGDGLALRGCYLHIPWVLRLIGLDKLRYIGCCTEA